MAHIRSPARSSFYVKRAHLGKVPGIEAFLAEFTSEKAWGEEGYLVDKGMIPMPPAERERFAANVKMLYSLEK